MSFWTWLRDSPVASATKRSTRPAVPSGTRTVRMPAATGASGIQASPRRLGRSVTARRRNALTSSSRMASADRGVGDVERVEAQVAEAGVDPVDDVAEAEAVDHVAERATEQQAERDRQQRVPARSCRGTRR